MGRVILAAIVGAVIVFAWGFVAWAMLDLYKFAFPQSSNEKAVMETLDRSLAETGVYWFPYPADMNDEAAMEEWSEKHREGPTGFVVFHKDGSEPMPPMMMARGFVIDLIGAFFLALMMYGTGISSFIGRFMFAVFAVIFALTITHATGWNYMGFPDKYTIAMLMDGAIAWGAAGFVMAGIVKVQAPPA